MKNLMIMLCVFTVALLMGGCGAKSKVVKPSVVPVRQVQQGNEDVKPKGARIEKVVESVQPKGYRSPIKIEKALAFYDKNGRMVKKIELGTIKSKDELNGKPIDKAAITRADVSSNQEYTIVDTYEKTIDAYGGQLLGDKISLMNKQGVVLWTINLPVGKAADRYSVSDNGEAAGIVITEGYSRNPELRVLNKKGEKIYSVPATGKPVFSPNGRYMGVEAGYRRFHFVDLKTKKAWESEEFSDTLRLSDDGIAKVGIYKNGEKNRYLGVDLKKCWR